MSNCEKDHPAGPLQWPCFAKGAGPLKWACLSACFLGISGCHPPAPPPGYYGPTDPFAIIAPKINANDGAIPTLRGAGDFQAWIKTKDHTDYIDGQLTLLFQQPHSIRLIGKKDFLGTIFEIAANDERYWLISHPPDESQRAMWWGTFAKLDRARPSEIPIRPDLLIDVLGITPIGSDWLQSPSPVMKFDNERDAYVITWNELGSDRWIAQKEVAYDRATLNPESVLLYDANGRIVLRANLSEHKPIRRDNASAAAPKIATKYDLFFPDTGSRLKFTLSDDLALQRNGAPNDRSFRFPEDPDVARTIPLDPPTR